MSEVNLPKICKWKLNAVDLTLDLSMHWMPFWNFQENVIGSSAPTKPNNTDLNLQF